jgi:hypothetical protein
MTDQSPINLVSFYGNVVIKNNNHINGELPDEFIYTDKDIKIKKGIVKSNLEWTTLFNGLRELFILKSGLFYFVKLQNLSNDTDKIILNESSSIYVLEINKSKQRFINSHIKITMTTKEENEIKPRVKRFSFEEKYNLFREYVELNSKIPPPSEVYKKCKIGSFYEKTTKDAINSEEIRSYLKRKNIIE